jgi:hypothetical protein
MFRRSLLFAVMFLGVTTAACTHVHVDNAKGPDGGDWKQISCSRMNKKCFEEADRLCPSGYVFSRGDEARKASQPAVTTLPPREQWHDDMYSKKPGRLLVRCTSSAPKTASAPAPASVLGNPDA